MPSTSSTNEPISEQGVNPTTILPFFTSLSGVSVTDNLFKSYAQTFKKLSLKNQVFVKLELAKLFAEIELKDAEEKDQITYSPIYSVLSSNSETQGSNIIISEIDPQIVVDLSNTTRMTELQPNYNSTATQQQQTEQNNHIINYE
ncbi:unnamed protein product [Euphydryas editha]|uniref:Uncharacterized protein n=1 Tax=Euphydryas editha TaxID=104508 RepID=A0AAU9TP23_EUPED|nr:unnamed protein product [Euphydryas editha]